MDDDLSDDCRCLWLHKFQFDDGLLTGQCEQGYDADNPNIELLRLRNFTIGKRLTEQEVLGPKAISRIAELIESMVPFVSPNFPFACSIYEPMTGGSAVPGCISHRLNPSMSKTLHQ